MQKWSPLQIGLLVVAVAVFAAAAVLGVMALEPDRQECVDGTQAVETPIDRAPEEALAAFVGANRSAYPLDGWEVASTTGDVTVFTNSDDDGDYRVEVESGVVRAFERCEG